MKLNEMMEHKASDLKIIRYYTDGDLDISQQNLTSLEGCPKEVTGDFLCEFNDLASLKGCPEEISGYFDCSNNKRLTSLEGFIQKAIPAFYCQNGQLTSLKGCPEKIGWFDCRNNNLTSFEYFPKYISTKIIIDSNRFISFKDIDQHIQTIDGDLSAIGMDIISGFSDLFGIDKLTYIEISNTQIREIVNRYLPTKDLINFQDEMIKSGYESYL